MARVITAKVIKVCIRLSAQAKKRGDLCVELDFRLARFLLFCFHQVLPTPTLRCKTWEFPYFTWESHVILWKLEEIYGIAKYYQGIPSPCAVEHNHTALFRTEVKP